MNYRESEERRAEVILGTRTDNGEPSLKLKYEMSRPSSLTLFAEANNPEDSVIRG